MQERNTLPIGITPTEAVKRSGLKHIAFIMDGNGRWAIKRALPRNFGHKQGAAVFKKTINWARELGIKCVTFYAFSTENWKRSEEEVSALMVLMGFYIKKLLKVAEEENVRVKIIGERSRFAPDLVKGLNKLEYETRNNTRMVFAIAINYGARDEMRRGMIRMAEDVKAGKLEPTAITEQTIGSYLDTADMPDPDLLIRTSGELRLSNFLLWQLAYTEIYVTDVLWPDFNKEELQKAVDSFGKRERRYGGRLTK